MNEKIRKATQCYLINLPVSIYAAGCIVDTSPWLKKYINFFIDNIESKETGLFIMFGIIWFVVIGIVLFEIWQGPGIILGFRKKAVLDMVLGSERMTAIEIIFSVKFLIYIIAYICRWECTLILGIWEIMISLIYILFRIPKIINAEKVAEILYDNTEKSIQASYTIEKDNGDSWIIIRAAKRLNYQDIEECDELIRNMSGIVNVIKVGENKIKSDEATLIIGLMKKTVLLTKVIYFATDDRKRMQYIISKCYDQIRDADEAEVKKFLLLRSLLCDSSYAFTPKDVIRMLKRLSKHYEQCLRYLIIYIKCFSDCVGEQPWHIAYMDALVAEYNSVCPNDKITDWENCLNILYIEMMYSELNKMYMLDIENDYVLNVRLHRIHGLLGGRKWKEKESEVTRV